MALTTNGHGRRTPLLRAETASLGTALYANLTILFYVPSVSAFGIDAAFSMVLAISDSVNPRTSRSALRP
ncbi:hypothetical protein [Methylobacterium sp. NFXW15]|uniref:hypothetical protein n=1 Tax=Methylobacterium sp. NFXW15 TaxID=2819512 RepID=UPI003CEC5C7A